MAEEAISKLQSQKRAAIRQVDKALSYESNKAQEEEAKQLNPATD